MLAVPKAASGSRSESARRSRFSWGKARRLLRNAEFDAFFPPQGSWRASGTWIAMSARFHPVEASERAETGAADAGSVRKTEVASTGAHPGRSGTRFGILVAKRHAQRAVVRNTIRRVLRESARRRAASLDRAASGVPLDVLMRLKAPFPAKGDDRAWQVLKRELRAESDGLLARLERVIRGGRGPERDSRQPGPAEPARGGA